MKQRTLEEFFWPEDFSFLNVGAQHTAVHSANRLIKEEVERMELKPKCIDHSPSGTYSWWFDGPYPRCIHCGVLIKAKWELA